MDLTECNFAVRPRNSIVTSSFLFLSLAGFATLCLYDVLDSKQSLSSMDGYVSFYSLTSILKLFGMYNKADGSILRTVLHNLD